MINSLVLFPTNWTVEIGAQRAAPLNRKCGCVPGRQARILVQRGDEEAAAHLSLVPSAGVVAVLVADSGAGDFGAAEAFGRILETCEKVSIFYYERRKVRRLIDGEMYPA